MRDLESDVNRRRPILFFCDHNVIDISQGQPAEFPRERNLAIVRKAFLNFSPEGRIVGIRAKLIDRQHPKPNLNETLG